MLSVALRLGRVSNLPTVWTNMLTGVVLCGGDPLSARALVLLGALSLFYIGGMYLNDAFDREIDARERPERPIPSRLVSAPTVFAAGFAMIGVALLLLAWSGYAMAKGTTWPSVAAGAALAGAIVFYDWRHKGIVFSPLVMGVCRMLVYLTAGLAITTALPDRLLFAALVLLSYLIGLTYVAQQETLSRVQNLWPLLFLAAPFGYALPGLGAGATSLILFVAFLAWVLLALSFLARAARADVPRAVLFLIAGISLLDGLLVALAGHGGLAWLGVGGFLLTLALQRYIPGT